MLRITALLSLVSVASASAIDLLGLEARSTYRPSVCKKRWTGVLSTAEFYNIGENGNTTFLKKWGHYTFNSAHEVVYYPPSVKKPRIIAEFQTCYPNYFGTNNNVTAGDSLAGRIYIPTLKKCLAVENPQNNGADFTAKGPYYVKAVDCGKPTWSRASIPFNFLWNNFEDYYHNNGPPPHQLSFIGKTSARTGEYQGSCQGGAEMGYIHDDNGVPQDRHRSYATAKKPITIPLICDDNENSRTNGCFTEFTPVNGP